MASWLGDPIAFVDSINCLRSFDRNRSVDPIAFVVSTEKALELLRGKKCAGKEGQSFTRRPSLSVFLGLFIAGTISRGRRTRKEEEIETRKEEEVLTRGIRPG